MSTPEGYTLTKKLYQSAATEVYRGVREADGKPLIFRTIGENKEHPLPRSRLAFMYELLLKFEHANIVRPVDWVDAADGPWLIMEDIGGIDMWAYARQFEHGQLPVGNFLIIARQLADALSVIHHAHVIHKDLHPGNCIVNPETLKVQIIDFGMASLLSREQPAIAAPESLEGLLPYLSPEQTGRMNRALDYRTDFYTLGVTFYELLTGKRPFEARDALGLVYAHLAVTQVPVSAVRPEMPLVLSALVDKLLSKNAEERYQSAQGLRHDLSRAREDLNVNGAIRTFPLGSDDVSNRFQIPQKLYGRQAEQAKLLRQFEAAVQGESRLLAVAGYSGIGKSALVHEVHKPIAAHQALFLSGKFDQFQQNTPYATIKSALQSWLNICLRWPENQLQAEKHRLQSALGEHGRVLTDFLPALTTLLGEQVPLPQLGATETQARFHLAFQHFLQVVTAHQPWVLFIDDLQWADQGTLNLLPELLAEPGARFLLIVAYRDNEVETGHPALQMIQRATSLGEEKVHTLTLSALPVEQISQLLVDTLHRNHDDVSPLATLVSHKAGGNPFFTIEFLKTLYSRRLINFDLEARHWVWDMAAIEAESITDNVVDLMLEKMQMLPQETQSLLQLASCVGSRFDLELLSVVADFDMPTTARSLWPALKEGLLVQEGGDWFLGMMGGHHDQLAPAEEGTGHYSTACVPQCKFLHDRMLQAAYESLTDTVRVHTHLAIGRLLLRHYSGDAGSAPLFDILGQLNHGIDHIRAPDELNRLMQLNTRAAEEARNASVWQAANRFAAAGIHALKVLAAQSDTDIWQENYPLCYQLHLLQAECSYLMGQLATSEALYATLTAHTRHATDKAEQCAQRIEQCIGAARYAEGMDFGMQGLTHLGIRIATHPQSRAPDAVNPPALRRLLTLPELTDPTIDLAVHLLVNLGISALILQKHRILGECTTQALALCEQEGVSDLTPIVLHFFAFHKVMEENLALAIEAGEVALALQVRYPQGRKQALMLNGMAIALAPLKGPYADGIRMHEAGFGIGLKNGELARAAVNLANISLYKLIDGSPQSETLDHIDQCLAFCKSRQVFPFHLPITRQFALSLQQNQDHISDDHFTPEQLHVIRQSFFRVYLKFLRLFLAFWAGASDNDLLNRVNETLGEFHSLKSYAITSDFYFTALLIIERALREDQLPEANQWRSWQRIFYTSLTKLNECHSGNHQHKLLILEAEQCRRDGEAFATVAALYRQAIQAAATHGFRQYEALANELYGDYLTEQGCPDLAENPIRRAYQLYQAWECQPRLDNLPKRYPFLIGSRPDARTPSTQKKQSAGHPSEHSHSSNFSRRSETLDIASVIKASQAISGELELPKLVGRVMQAIMENAGAQYGVLVIHQKMGNHTISLIEALIDQPGNRQLLLPHIPMMESSDLPLGLVSVIQRTAQREILANAAEEGSYTEESYIQRKRPKSVLCQPVIYREESVGILYLENNLATGAFTSERLDIIQTLIAQAAISFENARLFEEVSQLNEALERKVIERTRELELANDEVRAFSYSVSHDLRSPIRALKGFSTILQEEHARQLDDSGQVLLGRILAQADKMAELVNGLLDLARVQSREMALEEVDLSAMADEVIGQLRDAKPERAVEVNIQSGLIALGDQRMLMSVMENLINNAWKYTGKTKAARIVFESDRRGGKPVFCVWDNGAGFDMTQVDQLFGTFKRLHTDAQFPGTGIGLATVKRIINRHGGKVWAKAVENEGAKFYFTLGT